MASAPVPKAFLGFTRLSANSYIYEAQSSENPFADPSSPPHPDLILFAAWLDAQPKHISKYIDYYKTNCPNAGIILLTASTKHDITRSEAKNSKYYGPAAAALQALPPRANVLLHNLSNGGLSSALLVAKEYRRRTGAPLPIRVHIFDSVPGTSHFWADIRGISTWLPKNPVVQVLGKVMLIVLYIMYGIAWWAIGRENPIVANRVLANRAEFFPKSAPRAYIYSREDAMVEWTDVESHIADAKELGYEVRAEMFDRSQHVGHMPKDSGRYWGIVQSLWKSSFEAQ